MVIVGNDAARKADGGRNVILLDFSLVWTPMS
jgi:hypothetical protein